jgi:hypothetical protein
MPCLLIRHKVQDYTTWASVFAEHESTRRAHGARGGRLLRSSADPQELWLLLEWDTLERARLFADSDDLRETMAWEGVTDQPNVWLLEDADQPTA